MIEIEIMCDDCFAILWDGVWTSLYSDEATKSLTITSAKVTSSASWWASTQLGVDANHDAMSLAG
jgi:hypothetical protein